MHHVRNAQCGKIGNLSQGEFLHYWVFFFLPLFSMVIYMLYQVPINFYIPLFNGKVIFNLNMKTLFRIQ